MPTLCIWIPSLSSPDWYFCNSDFLVLISLFGITIILWISLLYYAHLIFGFEIGLNKQLRFCLALVCTWFLFPDVTGTMTKLVLLNKPHANWSTNGIPPNCRYSSMPGKTGINIPSPLHVPRISLL